MRAHLGHVFPKASLSYRLKCLSIDKISLIRRYRISAAFKYARYKYTIYNDKKWYEREQFNFNLSEDYKKKNIYMYIKTD